MVIGSLSGSLSIVFGEKQSKGWIAMFDLESTFKLIEMKIFGLWKIRIFQRVNGSGDEMATGFKNKFWNLIQV